LTSLGRIFTWGSNQHGQLGLDSADALPTGNRRVLLPSEVKLVGVFIADVSAGGYHTLALTDQGQLYVFGRNDDGQLGLGDLYTRRAPTKSPLVMQFVSIAACLRYSLVLSPSIALLSGSTYACWPSCIFLVRIKTDGAVLKAVDNVGGVWAFGSNDA
jgi:alpha-tubulin suppressor-like RCC1 family protein